MIRSTKREIFSNGEKVERSKFGYEKKSEGKEKKEMDTFFFFVNRSEEILACFFAVNFSG